MIKKSNNLFVYWAEYPQLQDLEKQTWIKSLQKDCRQTLLSLRTKSFKNFSGQTCQMYVLSLKKSFNSVSHFSFFSCRDWSTLDKSATIYSDNVSGVALVRPGRQ